MSGRFAAASTLKKNTTSNSTEPALLGNKVMQPMSVGFGIVGALVLVCGFAYSLGLLAGQIKLQRGAPLRPRWTRFGGTDEQTVPDEVWVQTGKASNRLNALFDELDELDQSEDSPVGYITLKDLREAMEDERVAKEMQRVGISLRDATSVFLLLDECKTGLVSQKDFISGCIDMGARN